MSPLIITFTPRPSELDSAIRYSTRSRRWPTRLAGLLLLAASVPALLADDPAPSSMLGHLAPHVPEPFASALTPSTSGLFLLWMAAILVVSSFTRVRTIRRSLSSIATGEQTYQFGPDELRSTCDLIDQQISWRLYRRAVRRRQGWLLVPEGGVHPTLLPDRAFTAEQRGQFELLLRDRGLLGVHHRGSSPDEPTGQPLVEPAGT